jgi:hypothetical protein
MRTTLTVEDHLAAKLKEAARKQNRSFKEIINEALRRGLEAAEESRKVRRFRVKPMSMGAKPGIDYDKINQLLDEMEGEQLAVKMKRPR